LEKKNEKLSLLQEKIDNEFLKKCTFAPNTNNKVKIRRNFDEFYNDQKEYQKRIDKKKKEVFK
jgi:hypothetical protein